MLMLVSEWDLVVLLVVLVYAASVWQDKLLFENSVIVRCTFDWNLVVFRRQCFLVCAYDCQIATYIEDFQNERKDRDQLSAVCDQQRRDLEVLHAEKNCIHKQVGPMITGCAVAPASPVLTATGFVNRKWQFSTPHRIDTPKPITKKFVTGDYVGDPYGCAKLGAYPSTGGFWAHGWNITKIIFIYAFLGNAPTGQTPRRIFTHDGSNDADSRKDVHFFNFSHCFPFRGSKTPKTSNFGAWIGVFKPNSRNRKTCILSKPLHRFQPNFAQAYRLPNALRGWSPHTHYKSKMADGRHLGKIEKSPYLAVVQPILTKFGMLKHFDPLDRPDR